MGSWILPTGLFYISKLHITNPIHLVIIFKVLSINVAFFVLYTRLVSIYIIWRTHPIYLVAVWELHIYNTPLLHLLHFFFVKSNTKLLYFLHINSFLHLLPLSNPFSTTLDSRFKTDGIYRNVTKAESIRGESKLEIERYVTQLDIFQNEINRK